MRRRCQTFTIALLVAAAPWFAAGQVHHLADQLLLIPAPRELALSGPQQPLDGWQIVAPEDSTLIRTGADEINQRIAVLGGKPLPVAAAPVEGKPAIVIGRWWDPGVRRLSMAMGTRLTPIDPGEQGYVIRFGSDRGRPVALLGGSDELGTLYACITFRNLIRKSNGRLLVQPAATLAKQMLNELPAMEHERERILAKTRAGLPLRLKALDDFRPSDFRAQFEKFAAR